MADIPNHRLACHYCFRTLNPHTEAYELGAALQCKGCDVTYHEACWAPDGRCHRCGCEQALPIIVSPPPALEVVSKTKAIPIRASIIVFSIGNLGFTVPERLADHANSLILLGLAFILVVGACVVTGSVFVFTALGPISEGATSVAAVYSPIVVTVPPPHSGVTPSSSPVGVRPSRSPSLTPTDFPLGKLPTVMPVSKPTKTSTLTSVPKSTESETPTATTVLEQPELTNARKRAKDGMVMVLVPAGNFAMGSTNTDQEANSDEKPQHTIYLNNFWIDQTEVTNSEYNQCVAAGVCKQSAFANDSRFNGDLQPVVGVDWNAAQKYCSWVGARLPTEAEWEKAARGTGGNIYPWGNSKPSCQKANYWSDPGGCAADPVEVGSYSSGASPFGVQDMAGNVWEWVNDWYNKTYYSSSPTKNPVGPSSGNEKVTRGGSWDDGVGGTRAANRNKEEIGSATRDLGFRCAAATPP